MAEYKRTILRIEVEWDAASGADHPSAWDWSEMVGDTCVVHDYEDTDFLEATGVDNERIALTHPAKVGRS